MQAICTAVSPQTVKINTYREPGLPCTQWSYHRRKFDKLRQCEDQLYPQCLTIYAVFHYIISPALTLTLAPNPNTDIVLCHSS